MNDLDKLFVDKHSPEVYLKDVKLKLENTERDRLKLLTENNELRKFVKVLIKLIGRRMENLELRILNMEKKS